MHSCPIHDFIPCVDLRGDELLWMRRLTAAPLYPFFCTNAEKVEWFTAEEAADRGLVHVAYVHSPS